MEITGVVGDPASFRRKRRKASSVKPKIVCASCNNGWMSRLQEQAKPHLIPLFRGEECVLDAHARGVIAAWLSMTTMTASWANRDFGGWAIPEAHRVALYATSKAPLTAQIWIAPCTHDARPLGTPAHALRYRLIRLDHFSGATPSGLSLPSRPGYGAALSAGNLAALVIGHTYDPPLRPQIGFTGMLGTALKQVYPTTIQPVEFPRDCALDYDGFNWLIKVLEKWQ